SRSPFSDRFPGGRQTLADADAKRRDSSLRLPAAHLMQHRHHDAAPRRPERMSQRDRSAVDVELGVVEPKLALTGERLRGERLVDLDEIEIGDLPAGATEGLLDRGDRTDAHIARLD